MPRAPKKCGKHGCETRVIGRPYCDTHAADAQRRSNTAARGYDARHQATRQAAERAHKPTDLCCLCGHPLGPWGPWLQLDHTPDRTSYRGIAHGRKPCSTCGSRCNPHDGATRRGTTRRGR